MNIEDLEKRLAVAKEQLNDALRGIGSKNWESKEWEVAINKFDSLEREIALAKGEECAIPFRPPTYYDNGNLVPADVEWGPEAAVSGPFLLQTDRSCFLNFNALRNNTKRGGGLFVNSGFCGFKAVIEVKLFLVTKFGLPNDEAIEGHSLY